MKALLPVLVLALTSCRVDPLPAQVPPTARVEVLIPPKRDEVVPPSVHHEKPSYYQSLDSRLEHLQGQLDWVQKRTLER